jgi:ABC-2 type transport system ATP-binding protein
VAETVIDFDRVTKRFGDLTAVDDLSFAVPAGGIFGFLGGNGAGKTTSLRMALDILEPSSGRIEATSVRPAHNSPSRHRECRAHPACRPDQRNA